MGGSPVRHPGLQKAHRLDHRRMGRSGGGRALLGDSAGQVAQKEREVADDVSAMVVDALVQPLIDFQKVGKTVPFMDQLWPNPKVQQVHFTGVQDMFAGKSDPAKVLKQMDTAYAQK